MVSLFFCFEHDFFKKTKNTSQKHSDAFGIYA